MSNESSEKVELSTVTITDLQDKDEALKLVGLERTEEVNEERYQQVKRKLDLVIPPLCAAVYGTQYLETTLRELEATLSSYGSPVASIMGLPITGQHYNLAALAYSLGYLFWVFPTMYISQKLRLGKYLGVNIVLWGIIMMLHAVPSSFGPFFVLRFLLGMLESCVAPTLILIISMFYKKDEQATRMSWFYMMIGVAEIFGGFVAYGVSFDFHSGIAPYKIMYLLCGALAATVGSCVLLWMPDSPLHARFLSHEERVGAVERIREDQGGTENKKLKREQVAEALLDIRTWLIVMSTVITSVPVGSLTNFGNIVIKSFGYTSRQALILSSPTGAVCIITTLFCGWYSDRKNERMLPIIWSLLPTIIGAAMLVGLKGSAHKGALLFAVYIAQSFGSSISIIYSYNASNTSGHTKKVTINAMTLAAFCVGNIIGTETFLPKDAPDYIPGKTAILVLLSSQVFICLLLRWMNRRLNGKKRQFIEDMKARNHWTEVDVERERQRHAFLDMTDKQNPYFVYIA
ncbi:hypothetical protein NM688_g99 [Phlebia brevispora]|uniref:Uncharacterized protein n=1 Tax=Phlebia brevispora TaxID=194682 RepID=A0ACC1TFF2_9APHY|nr:hypothetical protein NM688_g99 [Phlebia brevispora]